MSKAFTKESDGDGAPEEVAPVALVLPTGTRNYVTPAGMAAYQAEVATLDAAAAAASPAPEAAARARAARRKAALAQRLELAEVIDPATQPTDLVRFGHAVSVATPTGTRIYHIVGLDETDPRAGRISWLSPIATALLGNKVGEVVVVVLAGREAEWEITAIETP